MRCPTNYGIITVLDTITGTVFIVDSLTKAIFSFCYILHSAQFLPSLNSQHYVSHSTEFCSFKHTAAGACAALCLLLHPYFFHQAWSTFATFLYTGRYMCDRFYVNKEVSSCGSKAQVSPVPPHCSHFYTITQIQTHQVGRLHL